MGYVDGRGREGKIDRSSDVAIKEVRSNVLCSHCIVTTHFSGRHIKSCI